MQHLQTEKQTGQIAVQGKAVLRRPCTRMTFEFEISRVSVSSQAALRQALAAQQKLAEMLVKEGISAEQLKMTDQSVSERRMSYEENAGIQYEASLQSEFSAPCQEELCARIETLCASAGFELGFSLSFSLDADPALEDALLAAAAADSRRKANVIAQAAGCQIAGLADAEVLYLRAGEAGMESREMMCAEPASKPARPHFLSIPEEECEASILCRWQTDCKTSA